MNVVTSDSMQPSLFKGDIVLVEKGNFIGIQEFNPENVEIGDIVIYDATWYPNPVIHRVINKTTYNGTTFFTIKGDKNPNVDPYYVESSQIRDRVITIGGYPIIIPKIGHIILFFQ
jgi:signal peptidase